MDGEAEALRYREVATELHRVAAPMRVLSALAWPAEVRSRFLEGDRREPPRVEYAPFDATPTLDALARVRQRIYPGDLVDDWLESTATALELTARMLAARGTATFHEFSRALYGAPRTPMRYDVATPLELAERVHRVLEGLGRAGLTQDVVRDRTPAEVAAQLRTEVEAHFGHDDAPTVEIVDELSANALATASRIKLRSGARFTARDGSQLLQHEAFVHVLTARNGAGQRDLPILAVGHPGTTRTQEGLAVFAELVSGTLELDRFRRLADRVVGVQMVIDGASFVELYDWFLERCGDPEQAFESTRRIFRGGTSDGGAPFTKDCAYLSGLLSVSAFVQAAFVEERLDCIGTLFVGKLDISHIPALVELRRLGLCSPPRHLPPWVLEPGWVLTWLTYSSFVAALDLDQLVTAARHLLGRTQPLDPSMRRGAVDRAG